MAEAGVTRLKITEHFTSLQGESTFAGLPCAFIRLTGCPLRCTWCDTEYSFKGGEWMSLDALEDWVRDQNVSLVEVTGGEPLAQKGCLELMTRLCDAGYAVLLETGGAHDISTVDPRVVRIMDVKCPSSGESERNLWSNMAALLAQDEVKFVLANREDYEYAREILQKYGLHTREKRALFSPVHGQLDLSELASWILEDRLQVRMQLQLHKLIWGAETQGV